MAVKFSENDYWNPAEWVNRTLLSQIVGSKIITNTEYEKILKSELGQSVEAHVWLVDFSNSEPYKLEIFQEIINHSNKRVEIKEEYREGYKVKLVDLETKLNLNIQKRSNHGKWNDIEGWKKGFGISMADLEEWAYSENGIFCDQDEDLMMRNPSLILPMFNLLGSKWSRRNKDLTLTLLEYYRSHNQYYREHERRGRDNSVFNKFYEILTTQMPNNSQKELIRRMKSS